jgi:hypothetical protein
VVAFVVSLIVGVVVFVVPFRWAMRNRPEGAVLTWGLAMLASFWAFFVMFWWYGVVPHQWLTLADNELNWRADKTWYGPWDIVAKLPFDMSYLILRDIIVVGIYVVALAANVAAFVIWQNRGKKKPTTEVARSDYGRPLVRA